MILLHNSHGNYRIATSVGKLKPGTFTRNQMHDCDDNVFLTQENAPETVTTAAKANSVGLPGVLMIAANVEEKGFYVIADVTVVLHVIIN